MSFAFVHFSNRPIKPCVSRKHLTGGNVLYNKFGEAKALFFMQLNLQVNKYVGGGEAT